MEIEGEDDSRIIIGNGSKDCGRGLGFPSDDRTVSRRHVSFELLTSSRIGKNKDINPDTEPTVSFEVLGKNPFWVFSNSSGDVRAFGRFERGELRIGDRFCVSAEKPILFRLKRIGVEDPEGKEKCVPKAVECSRRVSEAKVMAESIQNVVGKFEGEESLGSESLNVSDIDPVKEFGFVVMGHEFDRYPKQMVRDINNWKWYLEEAREDIEDDDLLEKNSSKGKKIVGRKKNDKRNDDEEWMGESEDEIVLMENIRRAKRPRHSMARSKYHGESSKDMGSSKHLVQRKTVCSDQGEDEEDNDEDNLGGFIVNDDDLELEEQEEEEEEEEEEDYDDDNDDDDENDDDNEGNDD
ncbi:glutamic acid-rich protein [Macadamia integrifolia]|uniref:glutamic acid-rich protein n=1 Tax=Macadamia integrifolia TaxID=60698 RepID=UPI001C4F10BF|nr:glutamic acid-rich protein [Macadamia integrifolia]